MGFANSFALPLAMGSHREIPYVGALRRDCAYEEDV